MVPPPMSAVHVDFDSPVNQVLFGPLETCNDVAVYLADGCLVLLRDLNNENVFKPPGKVPEKSETKRYEEEHLGLMQCCNKLLSS